MPVRRRLAPAEHRLHPRHDFAGLEGLDDVIVCAEFQPQDAVGRVAADRQHNRWDIAHVADLLEQLEPVDVRQTQVDDAEVWRFASELRQQVTAKNKRAGTIAGFMQGIVQQNANIIFIIDDINKSSVFFHDDHPRKNNIPIMAS